MEPKGTDTYMFGGDGAQFGAEGGEMAKKKDKVSRREELKQTASVTPAENKIEYAFGGKAEDSHLYGHRVAVNYEGGKVNSITFNGPAAFVIAIYHVWQDEDIADLLDVMRSIVAKADALEVLNA